MKELGVLKKRNAFETFRLCSDVYHQREASSALESCGRSGVPRKQLGSSPGSEGKGEVPRVFPGTVFQRAQGKCSGVWEGGDRLDESMSIACGVHEDEGSWNDGAAGMR